MQTGSKRRKKNKPRFGDFTLLFMPDDQSDPVQVRVSLASIAIGVCVFAVFTVGSVFLGAHRLQSADPAQGGASGAEASLELVSAEIASLMRSSQQFSTAVEETVAKYGTRRQNTPGGNGMYDTILSDNPDDLAAISAQLDTAGQALENIERLFGLNKKLLQHIPNTWPLPNNRGIVTFEYGPNIHPFTRQVYLHKGFDIAEIRPGAPILATADGIIEQATNSVDYGLNVTIRHRFGFKTRYAHMNSLRVSDGDRVSQGDMIGTLGSTGRSTGPHLHYELWMENQLLDPAPFLAISNTFPRQTRR